MASWTNEQFVAMNHCGGTTLDDAETEPVSTLELYNQGTRHHYNFFTNDNYVINEEKVICYQL